MTEETVFVLVAFGGDWEDTWAQNLRAFAKQDPAEAEAANLNADQIEYDRKATERSKLIGVWMNNNRLDVNDSSQETATVWLAQLEEVEAQIDAALDFHSDHKWCHGTRFKVEQLVLVN